MSLVDWDRRNRRRLNPRLDPVALLTAQAQGRFYEVWAQTQAGRVPAGPYRLVGEPPLPIGLFQVALETPGQQGLDRNHVPRRNDGAPDVGPQALWRESGAFRGRWSVPTYFVLSTTTGLRRTWWYVNPRDAEADWAEVTMYSRAFDAFVPLRIVRMGGGRFAQGAYVARPDTQGAAQSYAMERRRM